MPTPLLPAAAAPRRWWLNPAAWLAVLALVVAAYHYFTGEAATLPVRLVPHLAPVPLVLDSVPVGPARLPLPLNGFVTTLTHDVAGPYTCPEAAGLWLALLAVGLAGWLAVVSSLRRPAFLAGTVPVIFLLRSLNVDGLGLFNGTQQYFLWLSLALLAAAALGLQLFGEKVPQWGRFAVFGVLLAGLIALIGQQSSLPPAETLLHLAAYGTPAGAVLVALLILWVGFENIRLLLWFNTQAEQPTSRFGRLPFVLASLLYLGTLALYYWNDGVLTLGWGWQLDPLVLLLPAVLAGGLGLRQRAPSYAGWVPLAPARGLYWLLVAGAAGALGYALATANAPLLAAARAFSVLALGLLGAAFLLYVLVNFGALIQQRLRVYRVVFEPRRLPFYTVYLLGLGALLLVELRFNWPLLDQVQAGQYNQLGDLARQQSEARPDDLPLALLAERYYAESGDVLARFNRSAQLGRAALYRFRAQRQNELNALRRALLRQPDAKISLRLAALLTEPADFLDALDALRQGRRAAPRSFPLTSDLAQLFTRSALTDSVAVYLDRADALQPGNPLSYTNQLGFLLNQGLYPAAGKLAATHRRQGPVLPALAANEDLLSLLGQPSDVQAAPDTLVSKLAPDNFAQLYHSCLRQIKAGNPGLDNALLRRLASLAAQPDNESYYEQLTYLQALLRHARGQEVAARQLLAPLTAGTTTTAGYYQYVLGLWQAQQAQYATAASQLALATVHGAADARLPRAWALALSGQPDSARTIYQQLALRAGPRPPVALMQLGQVLRGQALASAPAASHLGDKQVAAAQQAVAAHKLPEATRIYQQIVQEAPFNETAMLAAARFYTEQRRAGDAYETLRLALLENPDSALLLQAYALAAADAGLADLGQSALAQLRLRLSSPEYANLLTQFAARRAAHAAAGAAFDQLPPPAR